MAFFKELFTWWNGNTMGTRLFTWRKGNLVGEDDFGNKYYSECKGERRWVIYNGLSEASYVPPKWHGWLHYTTNDLPDQNGYRPHHWEKRHIPNRTGSSGAYRPSGSAQSGGARARATGDYDAWRPD